MHFLKIYFFAIVTKRLYLEGVISRRATLGVKIGRLDHGNRGVPSADERPRPLFPLRSLGNQLCTVNPTPINHRVPTNWAVGRMSGASSVG